MNCQEIVTEVYSYLDGEIQTLRRARVEWHLRRCGHCADAFDFEERLLALVKRSCEGSEIPPELLDRLKALIEKEAREPDPDTIV